MSQSLSRRDFLRKVSVGAAGIEMLSRASASGARARGRDVGMPSAWFDIREAGAVGDGVNIDSDAINRAIENAASSGGGTVYFPAGRYASFSIRLKSHVQLYLENGAVILAATPAIGRGQYDKAEPQGPWESFQDYGHNHWHNSLIWGEGLEDISIVGLGLIWSKGLSSGVDESGNWEASEKPGVGNKSIALKNCRNVMLRDFSILQGGWFGLLATGVDNLTIENVLVDTNRDGFDLDCCRNVRVSRCTVNSPNDDGICPKSSYALGYRRSSENITISDCYVTGGYEIGSVHDASWKPLAANSGHHMTGRIKCGTESNGGFKNITIANCVFEQCRGLCLESVDGASCEDITITNITMREIKDSPLFLRLGRRMSGPPDAAMGSMKRVIISNVVCHTSSGQPIIIAGVAGHPVEDVRISDCLFHYEGNDSHSSAGAFSADASPPDLEDAYPEPTMFGPLPATGFFVRHCRDLGLDNIEVQTAPDPRPSLWLEHVENADFHRLHLPEGVAYDLRQVRDFSSHDCRGMADIVAISTATRATYTRKML